MFLSRVLRKLGLPAWCLAALSVSAQQPGSLLQVLSPPDGAAQESAAMGLSVAISPTYTLAGAPFDDLGAQDSGAVKVFDTASGNLLFVLRNPSPGVSDQFGMSVALSGNRVVIGASQDDTDASNTGIAYVYDLSGTTPTQPTHTLRNPLPAASDQFGFAVAVSGNRVAIGANLDDAGATNAGSVYVFNLAGANPQLPELTLTNPSPVTGDAFGQALSLDGRYLLIGAPQKDAGGVNNIGSVTLYDLNSGNPTAPLANVINPHPADADSFGNSISLQGTRFIVGVASDDATATNSGRAYVYDFTSTIPSSPSLVIDNPGPAASDQFGYAVAIHGSRVVVGTPFDDTTANNSGRAYAFDLNASQPTLPIATLARTTPVAADNLGLSVAISGDWIATGVPFDDSVVGNTGAVALYSLSGPSPGTPVRLLNNPSPSSGDLFGGAVSMSGTRLVAGVRLDDIGALNAGSAYVYDLASPSPGTPSVSLNNPNPMNGDEYGYAVAISGGWVAVGAPFADSGGVNDGGKVYIYNLGSATPSVPALVLDNPEPSSSDQFGSALALSGARLVVGVKLDDALATNSGSAYVYQLDGTTPATPTRTLRNPSPAMQDFFGQSVAISQAWVIIGTSGDDTGATDAGSAYAFNLDSVTPTTPAFTLNNPSPTTSDQFGYSVSVSGSLVAVGANLDDTGASDTGSAYIYNLTGATPATPAFTLANPQAAANDQFGIAVAIDGQRVTVGAHLDDLSATDAGAAWVYDLGAPSPTSPELVLLSPGAGINDQFGIALSASEGRVVAGASRSDLVTPDKGAAFVFGAALVQEAVDLNVEYPPGVPLINSVATVTFSSTLVGSTPVDRSFLIRSRGTQPLTGLSASLTGPNTSDFTIQQSPAASIAAGDSANLIVRFAPTTGGTRAAVLRVVSNDPDENPFLVSLSGNGLLPTPDIAIEQPAGTPLTGGASQINFGSIPITTGLTDRTFTINNAGTASLTGIQVSLSGTNPGAYHVQAPPASTLIPGGTTTFTLRFAPQASGELTAIARVASNDPDENPFDVFLYGIGIVTPNLALEQPEGSPLINGVSALNFGTAAVSENPVDRTFTVRNSGTGPLTGLALNFTGATPGDFQVPVPLPPSIPSGTSSVFVVRFAPTGGGSRSATLALTSNDANNNPFLVALSGAATVAPDLSIELPVGNPLFTAQSVAEFGTVDLGGQPKDLQFTLRNAGTSPLTGLTPSFVGTDATDFLVLTPIPTSLQPGQTTTLTVRFLPQDRGERFATLLVASNDPNDNPFEVELSGFAVAIPDIAIEQPVGTALTAGTAAVDFGPVNTGLDPAELAFVIRNTGSGTLAAITLEITGTDAADFATASFPANSLTPGEQSSFVLRYTPVPNKISHARLIIHSNDPDEDPFEIDLAGTGVAVPDIRLDQPAGSSLVSGVSTTGFGTAAAGESPVDQVFTLRNEGPAELRNIAITFTGTHAADFSVLTPPNALLPSGETTTFTVRFAPTGGGNRSGTLSIASNDPNENPFTVSLTGFATVKPDLSVEHPQNTALTHTVSNVSFGSTLVGNGSVQQDFTLRNVGSGTLNSLAVSFLSGQINDFVLTAQPPSILAPGQSTVITVTFTPSASGLRQTTLRVASNDPTDSPFSFALSGTGLVQPEITLEQPAGSPLTHNASPVNFGDVLPGGQPATRTFTLRNDGNGTLSGLTPQFTGSHASNFSLSPSLPASLAPEQSATFTVSFAPSATGTRTAALQIANNDPDENPFLINLTGNGAVVPDIAVEQPAGTNLASGFGLVTFGSALVRDSSLDRSFTLNNTGTAPLTGITLSLTGTASGDFQIIQSPPSSLPIGGSATFQVRFAPNTGGDRAALLQIASNDPDENPFSLTLTGFGVTVPDLVLENPVNQPLNPGTAALAFGTVILGQSPATQIVTIRNPGTGPLQITGTAISGPAANDFTLTQTPPDSVAPGAFAAFTLSFNPAVNGTRQATIVLSSNDADTPSFAISLNGTGLAQPDIAIEEPVGQSILSGQHTIDLGSVVLGAPPSQSTVVMRNTGTAQLGSLALSISGPNAGDFAVTSFRDTPLSVAESSQFNIRFQPSGSGTRSATLVIASNDPDEPSFSIALTGNGLALPSLQVQNANADTLTSGSASLLFGSVFVGANPGEIILTLRNTGTAPLTGLSFSFTGNDPFDFTATPPPSSSIAPADSAQLILRFQPLTLGTRSALLNIASNDPNTNPFTLQVTGSARDYFTEVFSPSRPNNTAGAIYTFRPGFSLPETVTNIPAPVEVAPDPASGLDIPDAYAAAELLSSREIPDPQDASRIIVERLVRTSLKHPLLFVQDRHEVSGTKRRRVLQTAFVADHILVKPKPGVQPATLLAALPGSQLRAQLPASGLWLVSFPNPTLTSLPLAVSAALTSGHVTLAEADPVVHAAAIPSDPSFTSQWHLKNTGQSGGTSGIDIAAPTAWDSQTGSPSVLVGVLDSGIDHTHPDLAANIWTNTAEIPGNNLDDDSNGYIDDVRGWNFVAGSPNAADDNSHGTHVAGTLGARGNNNLGGSGVAWNVSLLPLKILDATGTGFTSDATEALAYSNAIDVDLTCNAWGGNGFSQALRNALVDAGTANRLFVAAAGNLSRNTDSTPHFPASYDTDNLLSVTATTDKGQLAWFANTGVNSVHLAAPGSQILSTIPGGLHATRSGTSAAAAQVAGACALLKSAHPSWTASQIKTALLASVTPLPSLADRTITGGQLSLANALQAAANLLVSPAQGASITGNAGGPFTPSSKEYSLQNLSASPMSYTVSVDKPWVSLSSTSGSVNASARRSVIASILPSATALPPGTHTATLSFTQSGTSHVVTRSIVLTAADRYHVTRDLLAVFPTNPAGGTPLALTDDSFVQVPLSGGVAIPFQGIPYSSVFVGSNGYITFGSGDWRPDGDADHHFSLPRLSALSTDLNPAAGGSVSWKQESDHLAITFDNVPSFGTSDLNRFQFQLFFNGRLTVTILSASASPGVMGISNGLGRPEDFSSSAFQTYPRSDQALAVFTSHPASQQAAVGQAVQFQASAIGAPPIAYQWYRNGSPIPSATSTTYQIPSVTGLLAGEYRLEAVNAFGQSFSQIAHLSVQKLPASVQLQNLSHTFSGAQFSASAQTSPANLSVSFTYDGQTAPPAAAGDYLVVAQINDPTYEGSTSGTLSIAKAPQAIGFPTPPDQPITGSLALSATPGPAGTPVLFTLVSGPAVLDENNTLSFTGLGPVTITASQTGNINYADAPSVTRSFNVIKTPASITLSGLEPTYTGSPHSASATTTPPGLPLTLLYDGNPTAPTSAGTYTVTATIDSPTYQGSASASLVIAKAPQSLTFAALADQFATASLTLSATPGASGSPVTFAVTSGPATLTGNALTFTGAGSVTITASQAGNANYLAAPDVSRSFNVAKTPASVTLASLAQTFDTTPRAATATTTPASLPVLLTYNGSSTAPTNAGTYPVTATIDSPLYQGSASGSLVIAKAPQSLSFAALADQLATASLTLSATPGASGSPVTFAVTSGPATLTGGNTLTFTGAGAVTITASQAGNTNYLAAPAVARSFNVTKAPASVTLASLAQTYTGSAHTASASTTPSGLLVNFTYNGNPTPPTNAGSYTVVGTISDARYQGSASGSLAVAKASQSLTFAAIPNQLTTATLTLSATGGNSASPVTFAVTAGPAVITNSTSLRFTGPGSVTITASQAGDTNFLAATPVARSFAVTLTPVTITLSNLTPTYSGDPLPVTSSTSPAGIPLSITYNGSTTPPTNANSYTVVASVTDPLYSGTLTRTLTIAKAPQAITFPAVPDLPADFSGGISASGGASGNPVTFSVTSGPAVITGANGLSFTAAGPVTLTAAQAGNANYLDAPTVSRSFSIFKASAPVSLTGLSQIYDTTARIVTASTTPANLPVVITYDSLATPPVNPGTYSVTATIDHPLYHGTTSDTLTVAKAPATLSLADLDQTHTGSPLPVSASTTPPNLPVTFLYDGSPTPPSAAGTYPVTATLDHPLYQASASATLTIAKAPQSIDFPVIPDQLILNTPTLSATGGPSTSPVLFSVTAGPASLTSGNRLAFSNLGSVTVTASQDGDANFLPATPVSRSFSVSPAETSVTLSDLFQAPDGSPKSATATTVPPGLTVRFTYDGSPTPPTDLGSYSVTATIDDIRYTGSTTGTLVLDHRADRAIKEPDSETPAPSASDIPWTNSATGLYDGLLRSSTDDHTLLGAIESLIISAPKAGSPLGGSATGKLRLTGRTLTLRGTFDASGLWSLNLPQKDGTTVTGSLQLQRTTAGHELIAGTVTWNGTTAKASLPRCPFNAKTNPAPTAQVGRFSFLLPSPNASGTDSPGGDGWASLTVSTAGLVKLTGKLADGTPLTETAYLSAAGEFALFTELYRSIPQKGHLGGRITFADQPGISDFHGLMQWLKRPDTSELLYPAGFTTERRALGSRYTAPPTGSRLLSQLTDTDPNASLSLLGPNLPATTGQEIERVISWQKTNALRHFGPETLTATANRTTGLITGRYLDPATGLSIPFLGITFQKQGLAAGQFLLGNRSGALRIQPGTHFPYPGSENAGPTPRTATPTSPAPPSSLTQTPFTTPAAGTYNGVFDTAGQTSGALENLRLTATGAFSGTLWFQGLRYTLSGSLDASGQATLSLPVPGTANSLQVVLALHQLNDAPGHFELCGSLSLGSATHPLTAQQLPPFTTTTRCPHEGKYTLAVLAPDSANPATEPSGDGYATLRVSPLGLVTGALVLADSTKATFSGHVSQDGRWSIHRTLYGTPARGDLAGLVTFRSVAGISQLDGTWTWNKQPNAKAAAYPAGFTLTRPVVGSAYTSPPPGARALATLADSYYNAWYRAEGPGLSTLPASTLTTLDRPFTWTTSNTALYYGPDTLRIKINTDTGLVTGSYLDTPRGISHSFGAVILQSQQLAPGHWTTPKAQGRLTLEPRTP